MKKIIVSFILLVTINALEAQSFLNGSFEITTASNPCHYNLSNTAFNSFMSHIFAFGSGEEVDILTSGCFNPGPAPDGTRFIGLAASPGDEISMELSKSLISGNSYSISFWSYSDITFVPQGNLEIGTSITNNSFGTNIYTATTIPSTWTNHTFSFVASSDAQFITVRNVLDGIIHWNHIDNFVIVSILPIELVDFTSKVTQNAEVSIEWSTASEINNDYFSIERSRNGVNWEEITRIDGAGNSSDLLNYSTTDPSPFNGQLSFSKIKSVNTKYRTKV